MELTSPAFEDGQTIPKKYTEDGGNVSPPLAWSGVPKGAQEFALVMECPESGREDPWVHWVVYRIPGDVRGLPEGVPRQPVLKNPPGAEHGHNSFKKRNIGYHGPGPGHGDGPHHYYFRLFALDRPLELSPDVDRNELLAAMSGAKILAEQTLLGLYERK